MGPATHFKEEGLQQSREHLPFPRAFQDLSGLHNQWPARRRLREPVWSCPHFQPSTASFLTSLPASRSEVIAGVKPKIGAREKGRRPSNGDFYSTTSRRAQKPRRERRASCLCHNQSTEALRSCDNHRDASGRIAVFHAKHYVQYFKPAASLFQALVWGMLGIC